MLIFYRGTCHILLLAVKVVAMYKLSVVHCIHLSIVSKEREVSAEPFNLTDLGVRTGQTLRGPAIKKYTIPIHLDS